MNKCGPKAFGGDPLSSVSARGIGTPPTARAFGPDVAFPILSPHVLWSLLLLFFPYLFSARMGFWENTGPSLDTVIPAEGNA